MLITNNKTLVVPGNNHLNVTRLTVSHVINKHVTIQSEHDKAQQQPHNQHTKSGIETETIYMSKNEFENG